MLLVILMKILLKRVGVLNILIFLKLYRTVLFQIAKISQNLVKLLLILKIWLLNYHQIKVIKRKINILMILW